MDQEPKNTVVEENAGTPDAETKDKEKKPKKEKKQKSKKGKKHASPESKTRSILIAIIAVGLCLLFVSVIGMIGAASRVKQPQSVAGTTASPLSPEGNAVGTPQQNTSGGASSATPGQNANASQQPTTNAPLTQEDAEWLTLFNNAVNQLKTDGPSFTKSKQTKTEDIQLSNRLAQSYVSVAKDKYLSDETVKTDVAKGDTASAVKVVSPDGASYVSALTMSDIQSLTHTTDANGNTVVRITMADVTNPDTGSPFGKIFEFMTVDDVMNVYAPDMGATVDRANVAVSFSGCYAEAVIAPSGKLVSYQTYVCAHMILKSAKISIVTTDLDATLISNTSYSNIVW